MTYNPKIQAAEANAQSVQASILVEKSNKRPQVSVNLNSGRERYEDTISNGFSDGPSNSATLTANQLIYDGGSTRHRVLAAKQQYLSSQRQVQEISEATAYQLTRAYLDIIRYRQLIELAEENIKTHKIALGKIREKYESGTGPQADLLLLEARTSMAEATLENRRLQLKSVETEYKNLTGQSPKTLSKPAFPATIDNADINIDELANNPSIQVAKAKESLAEAQRNQAKSRFKPTVSLSLQSTYSDTTRASNIGEENSAFIKLSYDIFDSGRRKNETSRANFEIQKASYDRHAVEQTALKQYQDALNALKISESRIAQLEKYKTNIELVVSAYKEQFNLGQRALINVLDLENELFTARSSLAEEEIVHLQSAYQILSTTGALRTYLTENVQ